METHAYDELYLGKARACLGRMLDFAVNELGYDIDVFFGMFIGSGLAKRFSTGECTLTVGRSGVELAYDVLYESGIDFDIIERRYDLEKSPEYWVGWALAYYQWSRSLRFDEIIRRIPLRFIRELWSPYHEMDVRHFCDRMDVLLADKNLQIQP